MGSNHNHINCFGDLFSFLAVYFWAISKPIFLYLYQRIVNALRGTGMTEQAAKAIVSGIAILLILIILFGSF